MQVWRCAGAVSRIVCVTGYLTRQSTHPLGHSDHSIVAILGIIGALAQFIPFVYFVSPLIVAKRLVCIVGMNDFSDQSAALARPLTRVLVVFVCLCCLKGRRKVR